MEAEHQQGPVSLSCVTGLHADRDKHGMGHLLQMKDGKQPGPNQCRRWRRETH